MCNRACKIQKRISNESVIRIIGLYSNISVLFQCYYLHVLNAHSAPNLSNSAHTATMHSRAQAILQFFYLLTHYSNADCLSSTVVILHFFSNQVVYLFQNEFLLIPLLSPKLFFSVFLSPTHFS